MTAVDPTPELLDTVDNDEKPCGHGRMLRKEDPRFIRGHGRFVDDVQLPGMLHLAILRSPVAHAKILGIDTSAAQAHPKVRAVVTGADLADKGLAWMPTLSNDVQTPPSSPRTGTPPATPSNSSTSSTTSSIRSSASVAPSHPRPR